MRVKAQRRGLVIQSPRWQREEMKESIFQNCEKDLNFAIKPGLESFCYGEPWTTHCPSLEFIFFIHNKQGNGKAAPRHQQKKLPLPQFQVGLNNNRTYLLGMLNKITHVKLNKWHL